MLAAVLIGFTAVFGFQDPDPGEAAPRLRLSNPSGVARQEVVRFSMPWARGAVRELHRVRVGDDEAPCTTLIRWSDGSVAVSQVHARVALGPHEEVSLAVERIEGAAGQVVLPPPPAFTVELEGPWRRTFRATLVDDPAGALVGFASTSRVTVRRLRGVLECPADEDGGAAQAMFAVEAWVTTIAEPRRVELTLVIDADPRAGELVIGPARFRAVRLVVGDGGFVPLPRFRSELTIPEPSRSAGGGQRVTLVGPSDALYLGDRSGKAFRVDLLPAGDEGPARLAVEQPIEALPELDWVRHTGAFGAHGGPAPVSARVASELRAPRAPWWIATDGGPLGGFDQPRDPVDRGAFGMPPSALHDVLRGAGLARLGRAELSVLQAALRPTPGTSPRLPAATADLRDGLTPRAVARPHGYAAFDYEHFAVDLAHDLYWLTGDPFARHQLARLGSALLPVLRAASFRTSRGEGACLRAGVLIARATGDPALLDGLRAHVRDVLADAIGGDEVGRAHAIAQPPHLQALGADHEFDVPWQMGLLVHGLHALWRETGDELARTLAVRVARRMAGPAWIDGVGIAGFVSAREPGVRAAAPGDGTGAVGVAIGAFVLAAEMAESDDDRGLFRLRADQAIGEDRGEPGVGGIPAAWLQLHGDRNAGDR